MIVQKLTKERDRLILVSNELKLEKVKAENKIKNEFKLQTEVQEKNLIQIDQIEELQKWY